MKIMFTQSGHLFLDKDTNADAIIDFIIASGYEEEFCVSDCFEPGFIARLMAAGFLVMSSRFDDGGGRNPVTLLLPKHHLVRTILDFDDLHAGKTASRLLKRYELRSDAFDEIIERCVDVHGSGWLTPPLLEAIRAIRAGSERRFDAFPVQPECFGVWRGGVLRAGEFGVVSGRVYTSYSGYYDESSAGRVQMVLTSRELCRRGFAFWDLGMPLDYKYTLGAHDVGIAEFIRRWREAS